MNWSEKKLEDYFEFLSSDDIRLKGHRIGIDNVLEYYLEGYKPEKIRDEFPSLSLEQIQAAIAYYQNNQAEVDAYLSRLAQWREQRYQEWLANPSPVVQHLRKLQEQRAKEQKSSA
jgi:uncharacterized protein (DUF433 family)